MTSIAPSPAGPSRVRGPAEIVFRYRAHTCNAFSAFGAREDDRYVTQQASGAPNHVIITSNVTANGAARLLRNRGAEGNKGIQKRVPSRGQRPHHTPPKGLLLLWRAQLSKLMDLYRDRSKKHNAVNFSLSVSLSFALRPSLCPSPSPTLTSDTSPLREPCLAASAIAVPLGRACQVSSFLSDRT